MAEKMNLFGNGEVKEQSVEESVAKKSRGSKYKMKKDSSYMMEPKQYSVPGSCVLSKKDMNCRSTVVGGSFKDWRTFDLEGNKEAVIADCEEILARGTTFLIQRLVDRYSVHYAGYGGGNTVHKDKSHLDKRCPVCGGILVAGSSALCLREVPLQGLMVPLLLCANCSEAFAYANTKYGKGVSFTLKDDILEALKNDEGFELCYDMGGRICKTFNIKLTALHRALIYTIYHRENRKDS